MNKENILYDIDYIPCVNQDTIEELATLYQCGELDINEIPDDVSELIINNQL